MRLFRISFSVILNYHLLAVFAISLLLSFSTNAQPINQDEKAYTHAKNLYDNDVLIPARNEFESYLNEFPEAIRTIEAQYYIASSAVKLSQDDGEILVERFVSNYPNHFLASEAYLELARHFYQDKDFKSTQKYYSYAQENQAGFEEVDIFKYGYASFAIQDLEKAKAVLEKLRNEKLDITKDAAYFLGYIAFQEEEYTEARKHLQIAFSSKIYAKEAIKLYTSILYNASEYQELITLIEEQLEGEMDANILKIQADSYFELEKHELAAHAYTNLFSQSAKYRSQQSYYRAGVSYLKLQENEKSIDNLKRAALAKDSLGAYASYQLGVLYGEAGNLKFASAAFAKASKFDSELKSESQFLQAKFEFDLKNYDNAISLFTAFQKENEQSKYASLVDEMLSEAYLNTKNYQRAIEYIESLTTLTPKTKSAYQRVTFLKGIGLYNASRYKHGIKAFKKSLIYTTDTDLQAKAYHYIGEAYSRGKQYKSSLFYYEQAIESEVKEVKLNSIYGLAYAYFNMKKYNEALENFVFYDNHYKQETSDKYHQDILLRAGDCAYVLKDYTTSTSYYSKALESGSKPKFYIHFQMGLVYRFSDDFENAKKHFQTLLDRYPASEKADDALYQLAQMNIEASNYLETVKYSQALISTYPDSKYLPFALLNQAVAENNLNNHSKSIKNYTTILDRFPRHTTANSALLGLQELAGSGYFKDFESYFEKYKSANPDSEALENIEFETAQSLFYNQNYDGAIKAFTKFKNDYVQSALLIDATYFVADSWYRLDNSQKALDNYYQLADMHDYAKYRKVLSRIAALEMKNAKYDVSNRYFLKLKAAGGNFKDKNKAHFGLLSNYFSLQNYDSAVYFGNELMRGSRISNEMTAKAYLLLGKSEYKRANFDDATDWFLLLINDSPDERGAEAKYHMSKILFEKGNYKKSLQSLFELKDEYRIFDDWVGEAFLLMADNYIATDELFQAEATLNSLIENVKVESIKEKALQKLELLEKVSNTVESDTTNIDTKE